MYGAQLIDAELRDLPRVGAVEVHRPDVGDEPLLVEAAPDDALAVGREEGPAVVAVDGGEPLLAGAVGVHDVDLAEEARIDLELLLLRVAERAVVGVAHRRERDPLAVGRIAGLGVVAARVGQPRRAPWSSRSTRRSPSRGRSPTRSGAPCPTRGRRARRPGTASTWDRGASTRRGSGRCPAGRTRRSSCPCRARCAWCRRS